MKKYKTDNTRIEIDILIDSKEPDKQKIYTNYYQGGDNKGMQGVTLPASICKQSFNDANFTQHIINFFIKSNWQSKNKL